MWFNNTVIYQIPLRSFRDGNGDGIGDILGLVEKLDYLRYLGVGAVYLNPITKSPPFEDSSLLTGKDQFLGYEVLDHFALNPAYGTREDFQTLLNEAHQRGIRVILDFVTVGLSPSHHYFLDFCEKGRSSKFASFFIVHDQIPSGSWLNSQGKPWHLLQDGRVYYALWRNYPFLNFRESKVVRYVHRVADYWLTMGVDGFRLDAAKYLFFNGPGADGQEHQGETLKFWRQFGRRVRARHGREIVLLAEILPIPHDVDYSDSRGASFDFLLDGVFTEAIYGHQTVDFDGFTADYLAGWFQDSDNRHGIAYHSNHDRGRLAAKACRASPEQLKLAASLLLMSNGVPMIYYGDEIGLQGAKSDCEVGWVSTMAWHGSAPNGGFSDSPKLGAPLSEDYVVHNVSAQQQNLSSLLNHYRALILMRMNYPVFARGKRWKIRTDNPKIYVYFLYDETSVILVLHNLSKHAETATIKLPFGGHEWQVIFGEKHISFARTGTKLTISHLDPHASAVILCKGTGINDFELLLPDFTYPRRLAVGASVVKAKVRRCFKLDLEQCCALRLAYPDRAVTIKFFAKEKHNIVLTNEVLVEKPASDCLIPVPDCAEYVNVAGTEDFEVVPFDWKNHLSILVNFSAITPLNQNLKFFRYGFDAAQLYFELGPRMPLAMPKGAGLNFAMLIADPDADDKTGVSDLSFWLLPKITTSRPVHSIVVYQENTGEMKPVLFTGMAPSQMPGIKCAEAIMFHKTQDSWCFAISRQALSGKHYQMAFIAWSAGGRWLDMPSGKSPILEMLPYDEEEMAKEHPSHVVRFFDICITDEEF
ncbi:maltose alpha-D-glucosyltransferase / alpha-amylase [Methylococcales bacterium]|nr:maltose alpha-D-glucosyltransferase / alpha-amylase [Methylococcales bacterium]